MRLFFAITPDRPAEAQLAQRLLQLQEATGEMASRLRWTPAGNIHATLHFLGEVRAARVAALRGVASTPIAESPFDIELGAFGAFPEAGAPRVVWLDVTRGLEDLRRVHAELGRRLTSAGFELEPRPFSPHLTVARVPDRERAHVKALRARLADVPITPISWTADRVVLFRSDLSGPVPRYEAIEEVALTAG